MLDQDRFIVNDFRGLWDRVEQYPQGYGPVASNCRFKDGFAYPREPVDQSISLSALLLGADIKEFYPFRLASAPFTVRYLVLTYDGTNGRLYDTGSATPSTPLFTKLGMQSFGLQILYSRAYITPGTGNRGMSSEFVYVYDPATMTAPRKAAGAKPATALTPAVGAAGKVAPGFHLFTYAYETDTGFITKYATPAGLTIPAGTPSIVNLTAVANGPTGTVKKHLLMTTVIQNYDNNPDHYEFFFAGVINDNVTTTASIDLYDTQLVQSGAYLLDQLEEIPAGLGIGVAFNRLMTWNENTEANDSLVRLSKSGDPESFNASSGFATTGKGEGGRIQNAREYRGVLYTFKGRRTYGVTPTDGEPNTWPVQTIDDNKGTNRRGIAEIVDAVGNSLDFLIINCFDGLYPFDGTYPDMPLTYAIENTYRETASRFFGGNHLVCDPVTKRIFLSIQSSSDGAYSLYSVDFSQGMSFDKVRWSFWGVTHFIDLDPHGPNSMHIEPISVSGQETSRLVFTDPSDNRFIKGILLNEALPSVGDTDYDGNPANITFNLSIGDALFDGAVINSFNGYRVRGLLTSFDFSVVADNGIGTSFTGLSTSSNYKYGKMNIVSERLQSVKVEKIGQSFGSIGTPHRIMEIIVFGKPLWTQRPM